MKLRNSIAVLFILSAIISCVDAQDAQFPPNVLNLLEKLTQWEEEQNIAHERRIQEKRATVAELLHADLESATRAGNLDLALKIKNEISKLQQPLNPNGESDSEVKSGDMPGSNTQTSLSSRERAALAEKFVGIWAWGDGGGHFNANNGKIFYGREVWSYEVGRDGFIEIKDSNDRVARLLMSPDFNSISGIDFEGNTVSKQRKKG